MKIVLKNEIKQQREKKTNYHQSKIKVGNKLVRNKAGTSESYIWFVERSNLRREVATEVG